MLCSLACPATERYTLPVLENIEDSVLMCDLLMTGIIACCKDHLVWLLGTVLYCTVRMPVHDLPVHDMWGMCGMASACRGS